MHLSLARRRQRLSWARTNDVVVVVDGLQQQGLRCCLYIQLQCHTIRASAPHTRNSALTSQRRNAFAKPPARTSHKFRRCIARTHRRPLAKTAAAAGSLSVHNFDWQKIAHLRWLCDDCCSDRRVYDATTTTISCSNTC